MITKIDHDGIIDVFVKWNPAFYKCHQFISFYDQGLSYCFLDDNFEQSHAFSLCREVLQEILYLFYKEDKTYTARYNLKNIKKPCQHVTRLAICNSKDKYFDRSVCGKLIPFLHQIEDRFGIERTKFYKCANPGNYKCVFVLDGSIRWIHSPILLSLYSFLIRIGMVYDHSDCIHFIKNMEKSYYGSRDVEIAQCAKEAIFLLLENDEREIFYCVRDRNYHFDGLTRACDVGILWFADLLYRIKNDKVDYNAICDIVAYIVKNVSSIIHERSSTR